MRLFFVTIILSVFSYELIAQPNSGYITKNGAWCWFSDPRAIIIGDNIITGWVKTNGTIEAGRLDLKTNTVETNVLYHKLEKDDHNNPSFLLVDEKKVLAMYTQHNKRELFINTLNDFSNSFEFSEVRRVNPVSREEYRKFPKRTVTYVNPVKLATENDRLYCFGRWTGFKPNLMWSDDGGLKWSKAKVFITKRPFNKKNRPYIKYYSDGTSKIHMAFTDGHPKVEPLNGVYYAYFEKGEFFKANGEVICDIENMPFEPHQASLIYVPNDLDGRAWIADIGQDENSNPVVLFTKSPSQLNHEYWYAIFINNNWIINKICDSGEWFPKTKKNKKESEPYYFGNMTIHPENSNIVYLSRKVNGVFEIERWETKDFGKSWKNESITKNSKYDNVRPFLPRGLKKDENEVVLWMENKKYTHFTKFKSSIKYYFREQ
ncbi:MAG: BNR-4 repeat-containing protein [Flavobacteriaceae bacterium]